MKTKLMLSTLVAAALGTGAAFAADSTDKAKSGAEYTQKQLQKSGSGGNAAAEEANRGSKMSDKRMKHGDMKNGDMKNGDMKKRDMHKRDKSLTEEKPGTASDAGTKAIGDGTKKP